MQFNKESINSEKISSQSSKFPEKIEELRKFIENLPLTVKINQLQSDWSFFNKGIAMAKRYNLEPIIAGKSERYGIPPIAFTDGPRGIVMNSSTCFPVSIARGASWDIELEEKIGDAIGIEARAQGANFFAGVCINLLRHPAWGRAQETYGEDPFLLGEMGSALIRGVQRHTMACVKHFACNSMENARFKVNVKIDERTLREIYLPHFHKCVKSGVSAVMSAYNKVNGEYCGENEYLLNKILKEEWQFNGFVMSDFIFGVYDGIKGIKSGLDVEMPFKWRMHPKKIKKWLEKGKISIEHIDNAVLRILTEKQKQLYQRPSDDLYSKSQIASEKHILLARIAAEKSIVLLKNQDNILPLEISDGNIKTILVVGKLANTINLGDRGSSRVYPPYAITPLEGITSYIKNSNYDINVLYDNCSDLKKLDKKIRKADIIIGVFGNTWKDEGEFMTPKTGGDRKNLRLSNKDEKIIHYLSENHPEVIICLEGGSAFITDSWDKSISALLMLWYPGMEGGNALANILFGDVSPSGKLPCIFPSSDNQLPFFDRNAKEITYDYLHGYRLLASNGEQPNYPFGYGLSYTKFSYSELEIEVDESKLLLRIDFNLKNNGDFYGEEIVQVYVSFPGIDVFRAPRELKGFKRIKLAPEESVNVSFLITFEELKYYNVTK